jgi:hypothetical protein
MYPVSAIADELPSRSMKKRILFTVILFICLIVRAQEYITFADLGITGNYRINVGF